MKDQDPLIAEAKATYLVGRKAVEQGYKFVICEGDAMNVIQSIQNSSISPHWFIESIVRRLSVF